MPEVDSKIMITGSLYDHLKFGVQVLLPGIGALYFGLAQIWALPEPERIIGTISVISVFLGLIVRSSARSYEKSGAKYSGDMVVDYDSDDQPSTLRMELKDQPINLADGKEVTFLVKDGKHARPEPV